MAAPDHLPLSCEYAAAAVLTPVVAGSPFLGRMFRNC